MNYAGIQVAHVRCIRNGADIIPDTVATRSVAPTLSDPRDDEQLWQEVGEVTVSSDQTNLGNSTPVMRKKQFTCTLERAKDIRSGPISRTLTFTVVNRTLLLAELHMMTGQIDDSATGDGAYTTVTPFAGGANPIEGWFGISYFDESGLLLTNELHWGELRLGQPLAGGNTAQVTPQYVLELFPDPASTGKVLKKTT